MAKKDEVKTGELVPSGPQAIGNALPDFIPVAAPEDREAFTTEDIQMPRLAIAQGSSPAKIEGKPEYIEGLKLGDLYNTLTSEIYGKEPMEFIILKRIPPYWKEFDSDRNLVDPNVPANDPRTLWRPPLEPGGKRQKPIATQFYDYIVLLPQSMEPVVISCSRTNTPPAKKLNGLINFRAGQPVPLYARRFVVTTAQQTDKDKTWYTYVFRNSGTPGVPNSDLVQTRELFEHAKNLHDMLLDVVVTYKVEDDTPDIEGVASFDMAKMEQTAARESGTGKM